MGIFDKLLSKNESYCPRSEHEAWVAILYTCISIDGEVSDVENDAFLRLLLFKNKFAGIEVVPLYKSAMVAKKTFGGRHIIDTSALLIKEEDRQTVLALAAELVLADGIVTQKEKELLEYVATKLGIDEQLAAKIFEVILIKNRDNRMLG